MTFLVPGHGTISARVRAALQRPALCPGEPDYEALAQGVRQKLLRAFVPGAESEYSAVLLPGAGSSAVEAAVLSSFPSGKRALIINNGFHGERLAAIVGVHRLGVAEFKLDWHARPDPEKLRLALRQHPEVHMVAMVHHETSTGLVNPVKAIAEVVDSQNRVFVLDAVSGLGGEELDVAGPHLYMVAGSSHDCLQGIPGLSFVLVRTGFMERMKAYPKRSWCLHLPHYYGDSGQGSLPGAQDLHALDEALDELLEEGVPARIQRYKRAAGLIRSRLAELGLKPLLPAEVQSNSLTAYHLPEGVTYRMLHDKLKEQGYVIAPGLGQLEGKIFRVAHSGAVTEQEIKGFLAAFQQALGGAAR